MYYGTKKFCRFSRRYFIGQKCHVTAIACNLAYRTKIKYLGTLLEGQSVQFLGMRRTQRFFNDRDDCRNGGYFYL